MEAHWVLGRRPLDRPSVKLASVKSKKRVDAIDWCHKDIVEVRNFGDRLAQQISDRSEAMHFNIVERIRG